MTQACPVFAGASYRLTFQCVDRKYMLSPRYPEVRQHIGYALARLTERYGILTHSLSVMSNHGHLDVTDPDGQVSDFMRDFKSITGRALNATHGRWGYAWEERSGKQRVTTREAALRGMAYTIANPVSAGLVRSPEAWPGLITVPADLPTQEDTCTRYTFERPPDFFRHEEDGGLADEATLYITPHPLGAADPAKFAADVTREVRRISERKRAELRGPGKRFAGAAAAQRKEWWMCPTTLPERRGLNPRFAEPDMATRVHMLLAYKTFLAEYAKSLRQWRETGKAVFPPGTHKMRNFPGVTIRAGPKA